MKIEGSAAIVTGGASGLGLTTARELAAAGARVTIVDLPTSAGAERAAELRDGNGDALDVTFTAADVTDSEQVAAAVAKAAADAPLRIAVSCAGIAPPAKVLDRDGNVAGLDLFAKVLQINLLGTYHVVAHAAAAMARTEPVEEEGSGFPGDREHRGDRGVIINTASIAAFDGQIGQPAYAASKGGVHAMTLPVARELARHSIRVCTIAPGIMETPMLAGLPQAAQSSLAEQVPYPTRFGRPSEYAALVRSIVENGYLNGETIRLDGAIRMGPR